MLSVDFYRRDATEVAHDLVGATLLCDGVGGVIVEAEGYRCDDPACHAYRGMTPRNRVLFGPPGRTYVYFSYGMHNLLNVVAEPDGQAGAVLIRALEPTHGVELMQERRCMDDLRNLCSGPAKLTQALGIDLNDNDRSLWNGRFEIRAPSNGDDVEVLVGPRVGISAAKEWPWRFCLSGSSYLSRPIR